jgi:hypothetical protein
VYLAILAVVKIILFALYFKTVDRIVSTVSEARRLVNKKPERMSKM